MKRIDNFVDETSFLWFLALVMTVGFIWWLVIWAVYELLMSIMIEEEKESKKKKKKKKKPDFVPPAQEVQEVQEVKQSPQGPQEEIKKVYI